MTSIWSDPLLRGLSVAVLALVLIAIGLLAVLFIAAVLYAAWKAVRKAMRTSTPA